MGGGGPAAAGRMPPDAIFPLLPCCESDDEDELFLCFLSVEVVVVVVVVPVVVVLVVVPPVGSDEFAVVPDVPLVVVLPLWDSSSESDDVELSSVELSFPSTDTSSTCGFTGLGSGGVTMATTGGPRGGTGFAGLAPFHRADAAVGDVAFGPPAATTTVDVLGLSFESPDEVVPVVPLPEVVVVPVVVPEVVPDVLVAVVVVVADSSSLDESSSLLLLTSFTSGCFPLGAVVEVGPVATLDAAVLGAGGCGFRGGGCGANELATTADVLTALGG